jgi:hypothetical protein
VVIQELDGRLDDPCEPGEQEPSLDQHDAKHFFYTEIPHHLLDNIDTWVDSLIGFAFDTLHARHVELRVIDPDND